MKPSAYAGARSQAATNTGEPTAIQNSQGCGLSRFTTTPRRISRAEDGASSPGRGGSAVRASRSVCTPR